MRWTNPRSWILLVLLVSPSIAQQAEFRHDDPKQALLSADAPPSLEDPQKLEAARLVKEAREILQSLAPGQPTSALGKQSSSLVGTARNLAKSIVLWHNPESLETSTEEQSPKQRRAGNAMLWSAVDKLEKASNVGKDSDALFLLAEMNFYGNWTHPRDYKVAFERYKELADLTGNATAQHMVGFMYGTGIGGAVERDQARSMLYHTFAALNGNTRSEMTVGFRLLTGIGTPRNCEEASYYYRRVAEKAIQWFDQGPPGGQHMVRHAAHLADDRGGVYGEGASASSAGLSSYRNRATTDSTNEIGDVVEYLELLARKGNVPELFYLGRLYYEGARNFPRNLQKAKDNFRKITSMYWDSKGKINTSAPKGIERWAAKAAGHLGNMAMRGEAGPQNFKAALEWFKRGNLSSDPVSMNGLGYMYLNGFGVPVDRRKARELFRAATKYDNAAAQVNFGKMLLEENDLNKAKQFFEMAARHGHLEAYYYLAELNHSSSSKTRSCGLATSHYKFVAEKVEDLHSPIEWSNRMYDAGNVESALIGYMMAAEMGYESAQANVAYLLDDSRSALPLSRLLNRSPPPARPYRDRELALIYWTRSAKQANIDSMVKMGDYYLAGIGTEQDAEKAAACYVAAAENQASAQALWNLGWMHENGIGMEQDFHLSKRYYDLALETNHEAYLPVTLALLKLRARALWNKITRGGVKDIGPSEPERKRLTITEFLKNWYDAAAADVDEFAAAVAAAREEQEGEYDDATDLNGNFDVDFDEDMFESVLILGVAGAIAVLLYWRQWRAQAAERRRRQERGEPEPPQQPPQLPPGIWGDGLPAFGIPH